jgi:2,3,4,5-tetrahydropyridine-2-carboxylate N-succinyltransferase
MSFQALGVGIGTHNSQGDWLEVYYPAPLFAANLNLATLLKGSAYAGGNEALPVSAETMTLIAAQLRSAGYNDQADAAMALAQSTRPLVITVIASDEAPTSVPEVYLKLQLISHRLVKPHGTKLDGMFGLLPNVAWTNRGAIDINDLPKVQLAARVAGENLSVDCVDKFPKMTDYVVPKGVRIADTARVRLGAYLGEGTTIMHEGFVNFNAGTEGPGMIEGRISAGVFVGAGSDLGGGCSTMGTLSGGGNIIISVGDNCLIGANAGIGIPLGNKCTVESGLYITAGTKVLLIDDSGNISDTVKARQLAGMDDLLFRRNSTNGAVECLTNKSAIELNHALHANN